MKNLENKISSKESFYIPQYEIIKQSPYPRNITGTCGYTAACIVLNYWEKKRGGYIPEKFLKDGKLLLNGYNLQDELRSFAKFDRSWARSISRATNKYLRKYGLKGRASYNLFSSGIEKSLLRGYPVIAFGYIRDESKKNKFIFHAITIYGKCNDKYICHYGWRGYEEVLLDKRIIGSTMVFNPNTPMRIS